MTYKEFVNRPQRLHRRILHKADDVAFKRETCQKSTSTFGERVQTSPSNSMERAYVVYIDAKRELNALIDEYNAARDEVEAFFYDNLRFFDADLLEWRYIHDKSLQEIADLLGLALQTVKNNMSKAEKAAREEFNKKRY